MESFEKFPIYIAMSGGGGIFQAAILLRIHGCSFLVIERRLSQSRYPCPMAFIIFLLLFHEKGIQVMCIIYPAKYNPTQAVTISLESERTWIKRANSIMLKNWGGGFPRNKHGYSKDFFKA